MSLQALERFAFWSLSQGSEGTFSGWKFFPERREKRPRLLILGSIFSPV